MSFYEGLPFFLCLFLLLIPAVILGIMERKLGGLYPMPLRVVYLSHFWPPPCAVFVSAPLLRLVLAHCLEISENKEKERAERKNLLPVFICSYAAADIM